VVCFETTLVLGEGAGGGEELTGEGADEGTGDDVGDSVAAVDVGTLVMGAGTAMNAGLAGTSFVDPDWTDCDGSGWAGLSVMTVNFCSNSGGPAEFLAEEVGNPGDEGGGL